MIDTREIAGLTLLLLLALQIPAPACVGGGDVNLDGAIDLLDVQATIQGILDPAHHELVAESDLDLDGRIDVIDLQALIRQVLGTDPPPVCPPEWSPAVLAVDLGALGLSPPTTIHDLDLAVSSHGEVHILFRADTTRHVVGVGGLWTTPPANPDDEDLHADGPHSDRVMVPDDRGRIHLLGKSAACGPILHRVWSQGAWSPVAQVPPSGAQRDDDVDAFWDGDRLHIVWVADARNWSDFHIGYCTWENGVFGPVETVRAAPPGAVYEVVWPQVAGTGPDDLTVVFCAHYLPTYDNVSLGVRRTASGWTTPGLIPAPTGFEGAQPYPQRAALHGLPQGGSVLVWNPQVIGNTSDVATYATILSTTGAILHERWSHPHRNIDLSTLDTTANAAGEVYAVWAYLFSPASGDPGYYVVRGGDPTGPTAWEERLPRAASRGCSAQIFVDRHGTLHAVSLSGSPGNVDYQTRPPR